MIDIPLFRFLLYFFDKVLRDMVLRVNRSFPKPEQTESNVLSLRGDICQRTFM